MCTCLGERYPLTCRLQCDRRACTHTHAALTVYVLTGVTSDSRYSCYIWRFVTELHLTLQLPLSPDFPAAAQQRSHPAPAFNTLRSG